MAESSNVLRVFLRGKLLQTSPIKDNDAIVDLTRDDRVEGLFEESGIKLLFTGDGYDKIVEIIENEGICTRVDVLIQESICEKGKWLDLIKGRIALTSINQDYTQKSIEADVEDDTFSSKIRSRINQKAFLNVGRSTNDIQITPVTPLALDNFIPSTGAYIGTFRVFAYDVIKSFEFLVAYMTDGTASFKSDYLAVNSNWVNQSFIKLGDVFNNGLLYILAAISMNQESISFKPNISFADLFKAIRRNTNISMGIDKDANGNPRVRIENTEFFFLNTQITTIRNIDGLIGKVDKTRLNSNINVGNPEWVQAPFSSFDNDVQFKSFKAENYTLRGDCSEDLDLDLRSNYLTDSNILEDITVNSNTDFDKDIVLIVGDEFSDVGGGVAPRVVRHTVSGISPFHYNDTFKNDQIIDRWLGSIPSSVAKYIDDGNFIFRASSINPPFGSNRRVFPTGSTSSQTIVRVPFNNETTLPNFDVGGNYNNLPGQWYYTVPLAGDFTFETQINMFGIDNPVVFGKFSNFSILVRMRRGTTTFNIIETAFPNIKFLSIPSDSNGTSISLFLEHEFIGMSAADRVWVDVTIGPAPSQMDTDVFIDTGSYFACTKSDVDGGVYKVIDPQSFRARKFTFTRNLPLKDYKNIRDNLGNSIIINEGTNPTNDKVCWIDKISYNFNTSEATFDLISK